MTLSNLWNHIKRYPKAYGVGLASLVLLLTALSYHQPPDLLTGSVVDTGGRSVEVLTPNGGERFGAGEVMAIEWRLEGFSEGATVNLFLYSPRGRRLVARNQSGTRLDYTIPRHLRGSYRVLAEAGNAADGSDDPFVIDQFVPPASLEPRTVIESETPYYRGPSY